MQTEELRKWAKAYGVDTKGKLDREQLLKELVSRVHRSNLTLYIGDL
jgi:hypothetical protein